MRIKTTREENFRQNESSLNNGMMNELASFVFF